MLRAAGGQSETPVFSKIGDWVSLHTLRTPLKAKECSGSVVDTNWKDPVCWAAGVQLLKNSAGVLSEAQRQYLLCGYIRMG